MKTELRVFITGSQQNVHDFISKLPGISEELRAESIEVVSVGEVEAEVISSDPQLPVDGEVHTITEEDIAANPGIEGDVQVGDEVILPSADVEIDEEAPAETPLAPEGTLTTDQAAGNKSDVE